MPCTSRFAARPLLRHFSSRAALMPARACRFLSPVRVRDSAATARERLQRNLASHLWMTCDMR